MRHLKTYEAKSYYAGTNSEMLNALEDRLLAIEDVGATTEIMEYELSGITSPGYLIRVSFKNLRDFFKIHGSSYSLRELDIDKALSEEYEKNKLLIQLYSEYIEVVKSIKSICNQHNYAISMLGSDDRVPYPISEAGTMGTYVEFLISIFPKQ